MAFNFGTNWSSAISVSLRNTWPFRLTDSVSGFLSWSRLLAWVCGRSSGTPTVSSGADTMKMISSTSMTSTIGVTLISAIGATRRRPRRPPPPAEPAMFIAMILISRCARHLPPSRPLVDLARQDGRKLVGETFQPLRLPVHLGNELIVENSRRNGGDKADRGGKQRYRDAGDHHHQRGVFRGRDRLEARHDAPD